jgi:hypothetical protein
VGGLAVVVVKIQADVVSDEVAREDCVCDGVDEPVVDP